MEFLLSVSLCLHIQSNKVSYFEFCLSLTKAEIEDLQEKQEMETNAQIQRTEELEEQCAEKKEHVNADQQKLQEMKRQVAQHAINSRTGKPMPEKVMKPLPSEQLHLQRLAGVM